ncbi:uncharacterized protein SPPG_03320, partial [Spizellomyces punctatus DAOM BR117]
MEDVRGAQEQDNATQHVQVDGAVGNPKEIRAAIYLDDNSSEEPELQMEPVLHVETPCAAENVSKSYFSTSPPQYEAKSTLLRADDDSEQPDLLPTSGTRVSMRGAQTAIRDPGRQHSSDDTSHEAPHDKGEDESDAVEEERRNAGRDQHNDSTGEEEYDDDEEDDDDPETDDGEEDDDEEEEEEEVDSAADNDDDDENDNINDDDEEEEPRLKYQRLASTLNETLKKDAVSAMAVSDRFLALGTHWGIVHILDLIGTDVKRFNCHSASVNALSIDSNGEFVASASDDGKVVISSLYTTEIQSFNYKRPVKALCLEPDYSRKSTRQFVSGGMAEYLLMSGKGWFGNKDVVISSGEGPIYAVQWRADFIAWANEAGVKIYDVSSQQKFAYVDRPPDSPRADLFRCNLVWKSEIELLIGWADSVKLCVIKERSKMDIASGLPSRFVEIVCQFRTDFIISGIAPLEEEIVLLSYMTDLPESRNVDVIQQGPVKRTKAKPPEIHIVTSLGEAVGNDVLSLLGFEHYRANDYRLEYLPAANPAENTFYIVSPKDIVVAKPRDLDDHIEWLVERKRYEEALQAAEKAGPTYEGRLQVHSIVDIGRKYMDTLLDQGRFDEVASICPKILRANGELWEEWIRKFAKYDHLMIIYPKIPVKNPQLTTDIYEMVLEYLLNTDQQLFLSTIQSWPSDIYSTADVVKQVEDYLAKDPTKKLLKEAAMQLHIHDKRYDRALCYGLVLRQPNVLDLVAQHNLYTFVQDHALYIMDYDDFYVRTSQEIADKIAVAVQEPATSTTDLGYIGGNALLGKIRAAVHRPGVQLLVNHPDRILVSRVVSQLSDHPKFLHIFLDALFRKDSQEGAEFHHLQVELYAEYDYLRLIDFLRTSTFYSMQKAYEICETRDLVPEMVFLLGKMGDNRRALMLIIERLGDVKRAIEFAKDQNDDELWEDLLKYSMDKPPFIVGLLENLGSHIDPIRLVERIPNGLQIPGLRNALIKIMSDYGIQMSLREGCEKILINDTIELLETLYRAQRRGLLLTVDMSCSMCGLDVETKGNMNLVVFFCRHTYHEDCLSTANDGKGVVSASSAGLVGPGTGLSSTVESSIRRVYERPNPASRGLVAVNPSTTSTDKVIRLQPHRKGLICPICRNAKSDGKPRTKATRIS